MPRLLRCVHLLVVVGILLAACAPIAPAPTAAPVATLVPTPAPTALPLPTVAPTAAPTVTPLPSTPPALLASPPSLRTHTNRHPEAKLIFDRAMDQSSVAAALTVLPRVDLVLRWEGNALYVTPDQALRPGTTYTFKLADTALDAAGQPLAKTYRWAVRMRDLVAGTTLPTETARRQTISFSFNYALDAASQRAAFHIEPAVSGAVSVTADGKRLIFTPALSLTMNAPYTVTFSGALYDVLSQTVPLPAPVLFTTPSAIQAYSPSEGYISPSTPIRITFDRLMDHASTAAALTISPPISGQIEWQSRVLIFTPDPYLAEHTTYTVRVGDGARAADGRLLAAQPFAWSFRTSFQQPLASFGEGPNVQVLTAAGRRAFQFVYNEAPAALTFNLYALTTDQFIAQYVQTNGRRPAPATGVLTTTGAALVRTWHVSDPPLHENDYSGTLGEAQVPADVPPGLYVLELTAGRFNDLLLVVLSHQVLAVKQTPTQLLAWVTDVANRPAPGATVSVYAEDGRLMLQGPADANGLFHGALANPPQPLLLVATTGAETTVAGLSSAWQTNGYGRYASPLPALSLRQTAAYLYTDRPIYRPGQTVFFKAIVRQDDDAALTVPAAGTPVTLRVRDARGNLVQTWALATTAFGTVHSQFALAEGAMLGSYTLEAEVAGEIYRQTFKVQDYRKPDYTVSVLTAATQFVEGDTVTVTVDTRYFFGEPVANADLTVRQYQLGYSRVCWDTCTSNTVESWYETDVPALHAQTDAAGRFTFQLTASDGQLDDYMGFDGLDPTRLAIEVTVDDGSRQTVSGVARLTIYPAAEQVSLALSSYAQVPGQPFAVTAQARTNAGAPVSGRLLRVEVRQYSSQTNDYTEVVQALDLLTGDNGQALGSLTVAADGYYQLRVSGQDVGGRPLSAETWLYVFAHVAEWANRTSAGLQMRPTADSYAVGDVATLLVESSFSGPALLTIGRGRLRREQLVELQAPLTRLAVPIIEGDAPNIFATLHAWQPLDTTLAAHAENRWMQYSLADAALRTVSALLRVPATAQRLTITLTPNQPSYLPGAEATFTARVTNARGEPVSAELSLALVDEAIFSLSPDLSRPIFDAFYFQRAGVARTFDSLIAARYLVSADYSCCDRGGGGDDGLPAANLRSDFPDTAVWIPTLHTDWNGTAVVTVTLPDNLTTWRLTAKAITADTQVGEAQATLLTQQPISLRPLLPRSLTAGDAVLLSAMVRNDSDTARDLLVWLTAPALRLEAPATQTVHLEAGQQLMLGWPVVAAEAGEASVELRAELAGGPVFGLGDALAVTLPIQPLAVPTVATQVGQFSGELATTITVPVGALPLSSVRLELSRSIAGTLLAGLEYLTGYPYGCVEQTMSRALPNAVVGRALHQLGLTHPTLEGSLPPLIAASVQRLYGFQHDDGGWGWWYDDLSDDYQTAWVVFGLAATAQAGHPVDGAVITRGADWLTAHLSGMDARTRAFALYSLALSGHGDLPASLTLARDTTRLDPFSRAGLALALHQLGAATEAQALVRGLAATAQTQGDQVSWPTGSGDGYYDRKTMASATRSTALALAAFVAIAPDHPLVPGMVRYLMAQRRTDGWGTTNETSFTILALTDYLLARENSAGPINYQVELNGQVLAAGTLEPGTPAVTLELPASALAAGTNALRLTQTGGGQLYYVVNSRMYVAQPAIAAAGALAIRRQYLDPATNRPITGAVTAGQLVRVQLLVTFPADAFYVLVEDHLPGGLEALNEALNNTTHETRAYPWEDAPSYWREYGYNNKEVHGDRVSFFITAVDQGQASYSYYARAVRSGRFVALPAEASAMYDLSLWGRSASAAMVISE